MSVKLLEFGHSLMVYVTKQCEESGVELRVVDKPFVEISPLIGCSGFFDEKEKVLAVAIGKSVEAWSTTLAHEFCHMRQWIERAPCWLDVEHEQSDIVLENWLAGKEYGDHQLDKALRASMLVELDCERRTLLLLKDLNAPIDLEQYAQKANAYIMSYVTVRRTRKWYDPLNPPYTNIDIWSKMPKDFDTLDYNYAADFL